jgi:hypothetical protein
MDRLQHQTIRCSVFAGGLFGPCVVSDVWILDGKLAEHHHTLHVTFILQKAVLRL